MSEHATCPSCDPHPRTPRWRDAVESFDHLFGDLRGRARRTLRARLGIPPAVDEIADLVAASPELAAALDRREVREMLRCPRNRRELATLLVTAAQVPPATYGCHVH